jgi:hypothetical protein
MMSLRTLSAAIGHSYARCFAVLIDTTSNNHCSDGIIVPQSLLQGL